MEVLDATKAQEIVLDFTDIHYASRSFFDELLSSQSEFERNDKKVVFVNMSEELQKLNDFVSNFNPKRFKEDLSNVETVVI